jgi:hypothetical protein
MGLLGAMLGRRVRRVFYEGMSGEVKGFSIQGGLLGAYLMRSWANLLACPRHFRNAPGGRAS